MQPGDFFVVKLVQGTGDVPKDFDPAYFRHAEMGEWHRVLLVVSEASRCPLLRLSCYVWKSAYRYIYSPSANYCRRRGL